MSKSIWKAMCLDCEDDAGSLEYRWTLNRVDSTLVVENNLRDMVNTGEYHLFVGIWMLTFKQAS